MQRLLPESGVRRSLRRAGHKGLGVDAGLRTSITSTGSSSWRSALIHQTAGALHAYGMANCSMHAFHATTEALGVANQVTKFTASDFSRTLAGTDGSDMAGAVVRNR